MLTNDTQELVFQSVRKTATAIEAEKPDLHDVLTSFVGLFEAFETIEAQSAPWDMSGLEMDKNQFVQGKSLLEMLPLTDFASRVPQVSEVMFPVLAKSFSTLGPVVDIMQDKEFVASEDGLYASMCHVLEGDEQALEATAREKGVTPYGFAFVLAQLVAPLLRSQSKALAAHFDLSGWTQGYCPVCGSMPSVAYLAGEGGKRWLHCSTCGHDWRFRRQICPACGDNAAKGLEYFYVDDRLHERAYVCHTCKKYLLTIDIREMAAKPNMNIAPIGLIPLDIKAQQEGYEPLTALPWNSFE
ncbi:formate dehydrogenase accessory protein FdhE [Desulfoplanes formicivorans]|uniref:FdhE central domain-containing protein n=1 Tax=Desulfoplanes formicivorans TaxID=1592317 RepID=A0A194AIQ2_9BACT|nr:formate dehydrogenase accessory protein FdhE [Desulfoplanes formicivorans]GAU09203.1 hypothetical protein DPF_1924 [Desulfoplanes formicivorans]